MHVVKQMVRSLIGDVVFLQNICPINVHQATKEQKVTTLFKKIRGATKPLKIQASLNHLLGLFPMGCNQDKYRRFHGTAGRGGDAGGTSSKGTDTKGSALEGKTLDMGIWHTIECKGHLFGECGALVVILKGLLSDVFLSNVMHFFIAIKSAQEGQPTTTTTKRSILH